MPSIKRKKAYENFKSISRFYFSLLHTDESQFNRMAHHRFSFNHVAFVNAIFALPDWQQKKVIAFLRSPSIDAGEHDADLCNALISCGASLIARTRDTEYENFFLYTESPDPPEIARDERRLAEFESFLQKNIGTQESAHKHEFDVDPDVVELINLKLKKVRGRNRVIFWINLRERLSLLAINLVYPSLDRYHWPLFYLVVGITVFSIGVPFLFALGFSSALILLSIGTTFFDFIALFWLAWLFYISYILEIKQRSQVLATCLLLPMTVYFLVSAHSNFLPPSERVTSNIFTKAVIQGFLAVMSSIIYVFLFVERKSYKTVYTYAYERIGTDGLA